MHAGHAGPHPRPRHRSARWTQCQCRTSVASTDHDSPTRDISCVGRDPLRSLPLALRGRAGHRVPKSFEQRRYMRAFQTMNSSAFGWAMSALELTANSGPSSLSRDAKSAILEPTAIGESAREASNRAVQRSDGSSLPTPPRVPFDQQPRVP